MLSDKDRERIDDEAADWHARLHAGDAGPDIAARFEAWLHADRAHKRAYHEYEQLYRDLDYAVMEAGVNVDAYRQYRQFPVSGWLRALAQKPVLWGGAMAGGAAVMLAFFVTPAEVTAPVPRPTPTHVTELAEIREIRLEDGSVVTLGARSEIAAAFTAATREVTLLSGEAFFEVAKDLDRPFYVAVEDALVRVVGTKFDVKHGVDAVHVAVLEGVVEVLKPQDIPETIKSADTRQVDKQVLVAGDRVAARIAEPLPNVEAIENALPGAWRTGRLAYENASLAEIIADANRYHRRTIVIADNDLNALRATIAFRTDNIDEMLELIEAIYPVEVAEDASGDILLREAVAR